MRELASSIPRKPLLISNWKYERASGTLIGGMRELASGTLIGSMRELASGTLIGGMRELASGTPRKPMC